MGVFLLLLLEAGVKSVVLLACALALTLCLRRSSAATRQALWGTALAGALLLPALSPWMPPVAVGALTPPAFLATPDSPTTPAPRAETMIPAPARRPPLDARISALGTPAASPSASVPQRPSMTATPISPVFWISVTWGLGFLAVLAWLAIGLCRAALITRRARPLRAAAWKRDLAAARRRARVERRVCLLTSSAVGAPMTWGALRPVLLLPADADTWSADRRSVVLLHELAHIRRGDWLTRLLGRLACAVYWFNPLIWLAARRLTLEQEMACDEAVLALGTRPSTYAGHLLDIARALADRPRPALPAVDMARRSQMEGRLMRILDRNRARPGGKALLAPAVLSLFALVPALAAINAWEADTQTPSASTLGDVAEETPSANLEALLGRMAELESQLEPIEVELEALEGRLEPFEDELEAVEREMEPVETGLEDFEDQLEPFEDRLEAVEERLEPYEAELEAIEEEMRQAEWKLEEAESQLAPFEDRLEAIEAEMEPVDVEMEALEERLEPFHDELEALAESLEAERENGEAGSARLEELNQRMTEVHEAMEPLHSELEKVHERLGPIHERMRAVHDEMRPTHEELREIHEELRPYHERMSEVHERMEPVHQEMREIHREMEPVHERMAAVHEQMEPFHERMREHHQRMEPVHREMREVHRRMEPIHEQMREVHEELERELEAMVADILESELGATIEPGAPTAGAAAEILDHADVRLDDNRLRLRASASELVDVLNRELGASLSGDETAFAAAVDRAARRIADLDIELPPGR